MFKPRYRFLAPVASFLGLSVLLLLFWSPRTHNQAEQNDPFAEHPGWFQHFAERKGLEPDQFEWYQGLKMKWHQADLANARFNKKNAGALENVQEIGPSNIGGRTRSICIDYSNPDHLLAGGVSGGLWTSTNKGSTWTAVDDQAATLAVVGITQSPFDPDVFYYTTGESTRGLLSLNGLGVFKSTDGGQQFTHLEHTAIDQFNATWDIQHSRTMDSTIYVATNNSGLYRSTDAGASFQRIFSTSSRIHEIHVFEDSTIMIAVNGNGIHRIHEGTLQSTKLDNNFPTSGFSRIAMDYCESQPDILYAHLCTTSGQQFHSAWKSTDRGESWTQTTSPAGNYSQGWYDFKVAVSPTDPDFVLSLAVNFNYSYNGGTSWTVSSSASGAGQNSHSDYHEVVFYEDGLNFLVGNDGGIYRYSKSNPFSWTNLNLTYNVTQFYAGFYHPSKPDVVAGAQDNWTLYSYNGNAGFVQLLGGDGSFCAISQQDPNLMYISSQYMNIHRKTAGPGSSAIRIRDYIYNSIGGQSNTYFINPFEINLYDGTQLFVPTRKEVYRSNNAGASWDVVTADLPGNTFAVGLSHEVNPIAYFGGTGSLIHRLDDARSAALEEKMITLSAPTDFRGSNINNITVDPNDPGTIYVSLTNVSIRPRVWKITGADTDEPTWHDISANLPQSLPVNWIEVDKDSKLLIVATDYGVYTSVNGGGWWQKDTRFPNVTVEQLRLRHSDRKLYVFTHGRGAWTADLVEDPTSSIRDQAALDWTIYPNPASDQLTVQVADLQQVRIYDYRGRMVLESTLPQIDLRSLSKGTYFVEVETGTARATRKLMVTGR